MTRLTKRILPLILLAQLFGCANPKVNEIVVPGSTGAGGTYGRAENAKVLTDAKVSGLRIMRVRVNESRCVSGYQDMIFLHGEINDDSTFMVKSLLDSIKEDGRCKIKESDGQYYRIPIFLSSHGGYLRDGFELGRLFREYGVSTRITINQTCASSCAAAFLGGSYRGMDTDSSRLLFHSPYSIEGSSRHTGNVSIDCSSEKSSRDLKTYYVEMLGQEKGERLHKKTMSYCSASDGWTLNKDAAQLFGITTHISD